MNSDMNKEDLKELVNTLITMADSTNASKAEISADYEEKWEFYVGVRKKKKHKS